MNNIFDSDFQMRASVSDIRDQYESGELDDVEEDLEQFLEERNDDILDTMDTLEDKFPDKDINLVFATKVYILQIRSINPEYEIQKEMKTIEEEIRRKQKKSDKDLDRDEIVREWCDRYAPSWRDRHVMSVIYVFEQKKEKFLSILKE